MGRHVCLKEWINGNEISVSIDDNLCDKFRAEVIVFHDSTLENRTNIGGSICPNHMAELITKAKELAEKTKGTRKKFNSRILTNHEGMEDGIP